jgi:hypothetical protein
MISRKPERIRVSEERRSVILLLPNGKVTRITAEQARELRKAKSAEVVRPQPYTLRLLPHVQKWGRLSDGCCVMNGAVLQSPRGGWKGNRQ